MRHITVQLHSTNARQTSSLTVFHEGFAWRMEHGRMSRLRVLKSHATCPMLKNLSRLKLASDVLGKLQSFRVRRDAIWWAIARGNACRRVSGQAEIQHANVSRSSKLTLNIVQKRKKKNWKASMTLLSAVDCQRPNEIENGRVIIVNDVTTYGGSAEYHCIPSYNRIGPYLRKCMDDGKWSGDEPRCEREWSLCKINIHYIHSNSIINNEIVCTFHFFSRFSGCQWCSRWCKLWHWRCNFRRRHCHTPHFHPHCLSPSVSFHSILHFSIRPFHSLTRIDSLLILRIEFPNFRNKARPVKNTENVQAAERKEDQNAAVMSYSSLENQRANFDLHNRPGMTTFNTFHSPVKNNNAPGQPLRTTENIYDQIPNETMYDQPYEMRVNDEMYEPEPNRGNVITINGISVRWSSSRVELACFIMCIVKSELRNFLKTWLWWWQQVSCLKSNRYPIIRSKK